MSPEPKDDEPTQTTPAGAEIPVPERDDVMGVFERVARGPRRDDDETPDASVT